MSLTHDEVIHVSDHQIEVTLRSLPCQDTRRAIQVALFSFNSQGSVIDVLRNDEQVREYESSFSHAKSRQCLNGDETVTIDLAILPTAVEAIVCMVTCLQDDIAYCPSLASFTISIEMDEGTSSSGLIKEVGGAQANCLYQYSFDTAVSTSASSKEEQTSANVFAACKLYRRRGDGTGKWALKPISEMLTARSLIDEVVGEHAQVHLLDVLPGIELPYGTALTTVPSLCAALQAAQFASLEAAFSIEGLSRNQFVKVLLWALLCNIPELQASISSVTTVVPLLVEMFEQIDINGDALVSWEEFSTFCISVGNSVNKDGRKKSTDDSIDHGNAGNEPVTSTHYQLENQLRDAKAFPYQIQQIKSFTAFKRFVMWENKSSTFMVYDANMLFLHSSNCVEKVFNSEGQVSIYDMEYIPGRNLFAIATSNQFITLWSIINPKKGSYVLSTKLSTRAPITLVRWWESQQRLLSGASTSNTLQLWDLDCQCIDGKLGSDFHTEGILDCIELKPTSNIATCSFDYQIAVWDGFKSLDTPLFSLCGHTKGVRGMECRFPFLFSWGFDNIVICWDLERHRYLLEFGQDDDGIIGARVVSMTSDTHIYVVTGGETGVFRLWDLTRCTLLDSPPVAELLQTFKLPRVDTCRLKTFNCSPRNPKLPNENKPGSIFAKDIITGNLRLHHYTIQSLRSQETKYPLVATIYNSSTNTFVASVGDVITSWRGDSGEKAEGIVRIHDTSVCCLAFDMPRQRKLFVATSDGAIRLYNPVTGSLVTQLVVHEGPITSLIYISGSGCMISTGTDRQLCVSYSTQGEMTLEVIRKIEGAHETGITACAYLSSLNIVATGSDDGLIHVYDFKRFYQLFQCVSHTAEITALEFTEGDALTPHFLVSGDLAGMILLWPTHTAFYSTGPLMVLSRHGYTSPVSSICSTHCTDMGPMIYAGDAASGEVFKWDMRTLKVKAQEQSNTKMHFTTLHGRKRGNLQPETEHLLRIQHKSSVLKLRGSFDPLLPTCTVEEPLDPLSESTIHCNAVHSWHAHDAGILDLLILPAPATLCTTSMDFTLCVWDDESVLLGKLSSSSASCPDQESSRAKNEFIKQGIAWKFTAQDFFTLAKEDERLAKKVYRAWKRRRHEAAWSIYLDQYETKKAELEADGWRQLEVVKSEDVLDQLTAQQRKTVDADAPAFSYESIRNGLRTGVFRPEEAHKLRHVSTFPDKVAYYQKHDSSQVRSLCPADTTDNKPTRKKKLAILNGKEHELPVLRSLVYYPLEAERGSPCRKRLLRALDISPSPFLEHHMPSVDQFVKGPKSTPKKRMRGKIPSLRPSTSVIHSEVKLDSKDRETGMKSPAKSSLSICASEPILPRRNLNDDEFIARNAANISRKMQLYDAIGAANGSTMLKSRSNAINADHRSTPSQPAEQDVPQRRNSAFEITAENADFGPHYTYRDVMAFANVLTMYDKDMSGDIDKNEWAMFLHSTDRYNNTQDNSAAENLFYAIDRDANGRIALSEILPTMFPKATTDQLSQMRIVIDSHRK